MTNYQKSEADLNSRTLCTSHIHQTKNNVLVYWISLCQQISENHHNFLSLLDFRISSIRSAVIRNERVICSKWKLNSSWDETSLRELQSERKLHRIARDVSGSQFLFKGISQTKYPFSNLLRRSPTEVDWPLEIRAISVESSPTTLQSMMLKFCSGNGLRSMFIFVALA